MTSYSGIDPTVPPSGPGCVECEAVRRVVGAPAAVRPVRTRRLLRHLSDPARDPAPLRETGHPVVQSFEPGEDWFWDYVLDAVASGPRLADPQHHPVAQDVPGPEDRVPEDWQKYVN